MEQRIHDANVGEVKIADDVVAIIAGLQQPKLKASLLWLEILQKRLFPN